ncbi:MAG: hypothetical protein NC097_00170 [Clostridium sp.]|nr:hypothetical protein [Prevotella sp.]MCM1428197.1 hypothetical protein [Clostridium sp.]MCM1475928.1 hypothetical protein [Muribaculaceae bacterium]
MNIRRLSIHLGILGLGVATLSSCATKSDKGADSAAIAESLRMESIAQAEEAAAAMAADSIAKAEADSIEAAEAFKVQEPIVRDLYKYVLGLNDNTASFNTLLQEKATSGFRNALKAANEYDDGGYAIWELRTGAQDGDGVSKIVSVTPEGADIVVVKYKDMGLSGTTRIHFVKEEGEWKISGASTAGGKKIL